MTMSSKFRFAFASVALGLAGLAQGASAPPIPRFFDSTPSTMKPHTTAELNSIFNIGVGPYDDATMKDKIFAYPLPLGGQFGAPTYNGCYSRKGERLGDLDSDYSSPASSCATVSHQHPDTAIYRLFMGYKIQCLSGETTGTCQDAQLMLNCEYENAYLGTGAFDRSQVAPKLCSSERGILRHAKGTGTTAPAYAGCYPGTDGTSYPNCTPCSSSPGRYNSDFNPNFSACSDCPGTKVIANSVNPASIVWKTDSPGATSDAECMVDSGLQCQSGYTPSPDLQSCIPAGGSCGLRIAVAPKYPSPGQSDGAITATYSGEDSSTVSGLMITSPSPRTPTSTSGKSATFTGLAGGSSGTTYTISVSDKNCSQTTQVTLTDSAATPDCSACPSGSTASTKGTCEMPPQNIPAYTTYTYNCQGAGACATAPCTPVCQVPGSFGQRSSSDGSAANCGDSSLFLSYAGSCGVKSGPDNVAATESCPSGFSLTGGVCSMACSGGDSGSQCAAGQYSPSGNGGDCAACPTGRYKTAAGNATACDACPGAYIPNATGVTLKTASTGSTSTTACSVSYACPSGMTQGTNPASYTASGGYANAYCQTVAPSPTPSPQCSSTTLALSVIAKDASYNKSDGSVAVSTSGGTPPVSIEMYSPDGLAQADGYSAPSIVQAASANYSNLRPQNYTVKAWDANGNLTCAITYDLTIGNSLPDCSQVTCPSGSRYFFHYSQELNMYQMYCSTSGACTTSPSSSTLCTTPANQKGYYSLCGVGSGPGAAALASCSDSSGFSYYNDPAHSCGY